MIFTITLSFIQYTKYRYKWMKLYLLDLTIIGMVFAIFHYLHILYPNFLTSDIEMRLDALILGVLVFLLVIIHCFVFPFFTLHFTETGGKKRNRILFFLPQVLLFLVIILAIVFESTITAYLFPVGFLLEAIIFPLLILYLLSFHILVMVKHKKILQQKTKRSAFAYVFISALFLLMEIILIFVPTTKWIEQFESMNIFIFSFFIFSTILWLNIKQLLDTGNITVKEVPTDLVQEYKITQRERDILDLLIIGKTNKEIGDILFISTKTVETHIYNVYRKMKVKNKIELLQMCKNISD